MGQKFNSLDIFTHFRCYDPTYCSDDPPMPKKDNTFYDLPNPKGSLRYMDGEVVTYTCKNSVYRFRQYGAEKEDWKDSLDIECGWENKWNPPEVYGCVDIRGCSEPPPRYISSFWAMTDRKMTQFWDSTWLLGQKLDGYSSRSDRDID